MVAIAKRRFERYPSLPDRRDKGFLQTRTATSRPYRYWNDSRWFGDQGATPQCVGYCGSHMLANDPHHQWAPPEALYEEAQFRDEWEGTDYDGSSIRGLAKALKKWEYISAYRWAYRLTQVVYAVQELGPVMLGTDWYEGMSYPDQNGVVYAHDEDWGELLGGHAYLITGISLKRQQFRCKNSWSEDWGLFGRFWIPFHVMEELIEADGEACIAIEQKPSYRRRAA